MEKEKKAVVVESDKSLMRKTKVELVEIILRKDDVERRLQGELKVANNKIEEQNRAIKDCTSLYSSLETDYRNCCDEQITDRMKYEENVCKYKVGIVISIIINILFVIALILG